MRRERRRPAWEKCVRTFCLLILATTTAQAETPQGFAERTVVTAGGISIEADHGDSAYVRELVDRLGRSALPRERDPRTFGLAEMRTQRKDILAELASDLGLSASTPEMGQVFDKFLLGAASVQDGMLRGRPARYTLWRKPDLVARLRAGQEIPGFSLEGDDVVVSLNASFEAAPGASAEEIGRNIAQAWAQLTWPVLLRHGSPSEEISNALDGIQEFRDATAAQEPAFVMTVLHETVEATLVAHYLRSADRRWVCEGIANHLALQVLRRRVGDDRARSYYDVVRQLAEAGKGDLGELERWPVAENPEAQHYPSELNQANYVHATWVIEQAVARHGADLIPRWLASVGKTPMRDANLQTVYAAFREITGEDLRRTLMQ